MADPGGRPAEAETSLVRSAPQTNPTITIWVWLGGNDTSSDSHIHGSSFFLGKVVFRFSIYQLYKAAVKYIVLGQVSDEIGHLHRGGKWNIFFS